MASGDHQKLANYLKEVHSSLRKSSAILGSNEAWRIHCQNTQVLTEYAQTMKILATKHWGENFSNVTCPATCRIKWCADISYDYFVNKSYTKYRKKEIDIGSKINVTLEIDDCFSEPVKLLDVGSCYNPFKEYDFLDVLAIDLCPSDDEVLQCDFLDLQIGPELLIENKKLIKIKLNSFEIVTFCFVLEYIPTSAQRISACEKAYSILKPGGLLLINTPDSKHVGANCKLMKCWQYTLAQIGFVRIRYEKFKHMHCMAFRKCLHKDIALRWATIHKKPYMEYSLNIPQDFQGEKYLETTSSISTETEVSPVDFKELPFCN